MLMIRVAGARSLGSHVSLQPGQVLVGVWCWVHSTGTDGQGKVVRGGCLSPDLARALPKGHPSSDRQIALELGSSRPSLAMEWGAGTRPRGLTSAKSVSPTAGPFEGFGNHSQITAFSKNTA